MADRNSLLQTLLQFLSEDTSADVSGVDGLTDLRSGLGLDSVDFVGLVMRIEGHYRIRFTRDELEHLTTVDELLTLLESKVGPSPVTLVSVVAA